jgi:hypothetical protein
VLFAVLDKCIACEYNIVWHASVVGNAKGVVEYRKEVAEFVTSPISKWHFPWLMLAQVFQEHLDLLAYHCKATVVSGQKHVTVYLCTCVFDLPL